jgi:hypothetical protein
MQKPTANVRRGGREHLSTMIWTGYVETGLQLTWGGTNLSVAVAEPGAEALRLATWNALTRWRRGDLTTATL